MIFEYVISFFVGEGDSGSSVHRIKGYFYIDEKTLGSKAENPYEWWKRYEEAIQKWEDYLKLVLTDKMHTDYPFIKITFLNIKTAEANQNRNGWNITSIENRKVEE